MSSSFAASAYFSNTSLVMRGGSMTTQSKVWCRASGMSSGFLKSYLGHIKTIKRVIFETDVETLIVPALKLSRLTCRSVDHSSIAYRTQRPSLQPPPPSPVQLWPGFS